MSIASVSEFGRWKMSSAAIWIRYRVDNGLCTGCGEHPARTYCRWLRGVAETTEPAWVAEVFEYYERRRASAK